eukprot:jgi/Psemu1/250137/estExt_Genewise1Plus.C_120129
MPRTTRRSSRNRGSNEIVAPGFGTNSDINQLTRDLGGRCVVLPRNAVLAMMQSEGRGLAGASDGDKGGKSGEQAAASSATFASPQTSSAWAEFLQEEGGSAVAASNGAPGESSSSTKEPPAKKLKMEDGLLSSSSSPGTAEYDLSALSGSDNTTKGNSFGSLVQTGTMDSTLVGRKNLRATDKGVQHLAVPTVLMPKIAITRVCASCNAAHAIAIDKSNQAYGWGRNEGLVLGSEFGEGAKVIPTPKIIATDIETAALGKSHTLFLKTDGTLHALGQNKVGQCAWRGSVKQSGVLKACLVSGSKKGGDATRFIRIACGEDFSMALSDQGTLYTTGSAEFGQLGNGETGEHFVTANKLAFDNKFGFGERTIFMQNDPDDNNSNDLSRKIVTIQQSIKIQDIAAGKHHALALEAPAAGGDGGTRIFSWGCGNYGVLGHNRQKDEHYPRHVSFLSRSMTFTKLAAGANCSLALTVQGHVYYWGNHRSNAEAVMKPQLVDALANNQHNVTHIGAGPGNVACTTDLGNTVVWGNGPYGELGLDGKKSSAKPAFVESITGLVVSDMAVGQGTILYVIKDDKKLPTADLYAIEAALQ